MGKKTVDSVKITIFMLSFPFLFHLRTFTIWDLGLRF